MQESRGLNRAITMSSLLERHEGCRALMEQGELVSDTMVRALQHADTGQMSCVHIGCAACIQFAVHTRLEV